MSEICIFVKIFKFQDTNPHHRPALHPDCQLELKDLRIEIHDYFKSNEMLKKNW